MADPLSTLFGDGDGARASGEPGMRVNIQVEAFVTLLGGWIASSRDELVARLAALRAL